MIDSPRHSRAIAAISDWQDRWLSDAAARRGLVSAERLAAVPARATAWETLVAAGADEDAVLELACQSSATKRANLTRAGTGDAALMPASIAERFRVVPLREERQTLIVATCNPLSASLERELEETLGRRIHFESASPAAITWAHRRIYAPPRQVQEAISSLFITPPALTVTRPSAGGPGATVAPQAPTFPDDLLPQSDIDALLSRMLSPSATSATSATSAPHVSVALPAPVPPIVALPAPIPTVATARTAPRSAPAPAPPTPTSLPLFPTFDDTPDLGDELDFLRTIGILEQAPIAPGMPELARATPAKAPRVLVIDECAVERQRIASALAAAGIGVIEAADGESALDFARRLRPDVVITEVAIPRLDALALQRALAGTGAPRFMAYTRQSDVQMLAWLRESGFEVVSRQVAPTELVVRLCSPVMV